MKALFLDLDGVVIDSIEETYVVSRDVYYGFSNQADDSVLRDLFYKHRGLVGPPGQFLSLHRSIEMCIGSHANIEDQFFNIEDTIPETEKLTFVSQFMSLRQYYQQSIEQWLGLNPLTTYGKTLENKRLQDCFIVTTKNRESVNLLLSHYGIEVDGVMAKDDFDRAGDKGMLITNFLDKHPHYTSAVFVDDHSGHLDKVSKDARAACFFADWDYGKNKGYDVFSYTEEVGIN